MPRQPRLDAPVRKMGYTGASVARLLGMTTSSVNRMAKLEKVTGIAGWEK